MIPTPQTIEVYQLANRAIELRRNESITMLEAIETVCSLVEVPSTEKPLKLGNVQAYQHRLQDAVTDAVYKLKYHVTDPAVIAELSDEELEIVRCNIINEQEDRISAQFETNPHEDGFPHTDAVDDQDGASELPPMVPEDRDY